MSSIEYLCKLVAEDLVGRKEPEGWYICGDCGQMISPEEKVAVGKNGAMCEACYEHFLLTYKAESFKQ